MSEPITIRPSGSTPGPNVSQTGGSFWNSAGTGPSFMDILDTVNPLHQIPGVSTVYQSATGDKPSVAARVIGGALFGGVIGAVAGLATSVFEAATGKDPASQALALLTGDTQGAASVQQKTQMRMGLPAPTILEPSLSGSESLDTGLTLADLRKAAATPETNSLTAPSVTRLIGDPYTVSKRSQLEAAGKLDIKA